MCFHFAWLVTLCWTVSVGRDGRHPQDGILQLAGRLLQGWGDRGSWKELFSPARLCAGDRRDSRRAQSSPIHGAAVEPPRWFEWQIVSRGRPVIPFGVVSVKHRALKGVLPLNRSTVKLNSPGRKAASGWVILSNADSVLVWMCLDFPFSSKGFLHLKPFT